MSIHEDMGWVRYREIESEIRARDRERMLAIGDELEAERPTRPGFRRRVGWQIMRMGARIAAIERS